MKTISILYAILLLCTQIVGYASIQNNPSYRIKSKPAFIENKGQWNEGIRYVVSQSPSDKTILTNSTVIFYKSLVENQHPVNKHEKSLSEQNSVSYTVGYNFGSKFDEIQRNGITAGTYNYYFANKAVTNVNGTDELLCTLENGSEFRINVDGEHRTFYTIFLKNSYAFSFDLEGVTNITKDKNELIGTTPLGSIHISLPELYIQGVNGRMSLPYEIVINNENTISIIPEAQNNDEKFELVLMQPTFSSLLAGSNDDEARAVDVDSSRNIYIGGETNSQDFPITTGVFQSSLVSSRDCFVAKYNEDGTQLQFSTFIGGDGIDRTLDITVNEQGTVYLAGSTSSSNFPLSSNAFQKKRKNLDQGSDAFALLLSSDGKRLIASTYFGGQFNDAAETIAFDKNGNVYISGKTDGPKEFTIQNGFQEQFGGGSSDGYVAKLNPDLSSVIYSSFLGGDLDDYPYALAVNDSGSVFVVGQTQSKNFPITPFTVTNKFAGGNYDSFITKISPDGKTIRYSTLVGGSGDESAVGIVLDIYNNAYVVGNTNSINFPRTALGADTSFNGKDDAFCYKISPLADRFLFSTLIGGSSEDYAKSINIDPCYAVYVSGVTNSDNLPISDDPVQQSLSGSYDGFLTKINADGNLFVYGTYLGGTSDDQCLGAVVDSSGAVMLVGYTLSTNFPTQSALKGRKEAFITKIQVGILPLSPKITADGPLSFCTATGNVTLDVGAGYRTYQWKKNNVLINGANSPRITVSETGTYTIEVIDLSGCIGINSIDVEAFLPPTIVLQKQQIICPKSSTILTLSSTDSLIGFRWFPTLGLSSDIVRQPLAEPPVSTLYTVIVTDTNGCTSRDSVWVYVVDPNGIVVNSISDTLEVCPNDSLAIKLKIENNDIISRRISLTSRSPKFRLLKNELILAAGSDSTAGISFDGSVLPGLYRDTLTIVDTCGNERSTELIVRVGTPKLNLLPDNDTTICANESIIRAVIVSNTGTIGTKFFVESQSSLFTVESDSIIVSAGDSVEFKTRFIGAKPGIYSTTIYSQNGCGAIDSVLLKVIVEGNPLAFSFSTSSAQPIQSGSLQTVRINVSNPIILDTAKNKSLTLVVSHESTSLEVMNVVSDNCEVEFVSTDSNTTIHLKNCKQGIVNPIAQIEYKTLIGETLKPSIEFSDITAGDRCIDPSSNGSFVEILPFGCEIKTLNVSLFGSELRSITPNPSANGAIFVEFSSVEEVPTTLRLLDIIGSEVFALKNASTQQGVFEVKIPTDTISEGLYILLFDAGKYHSSATVSIRK